MWSYLRQHPDIFMSQQKELGFFARDLSGALRGIDTSEKYLRHFADVDREKCVGEATPVYLFSQTAAREIYEYNPEMKIIVMLRDPVQLVYSLWSESLRDGFEVITDFETAMAAEDDRRAGRLLPPDTPVETLLYRDWTRYAKQIRRFVDCFGWDRIHVILFDDFKEDTSLVFREALEFLDVDPDFEVEMERKRPQVRVRNVRLQKFLRRPNPLKSVLKGLAPQKFRESVRAWMLECNQSNKRRPEMRPEMKRELRAEFAADIDSLSEMLKRDLSHWKSN